MYLLLGMTSSLFLYSDQSLDLISIASQAGGNERLASSPSQTMLCVTATSLLLVILLALCTLQIRVSLGNGPPVDLLQRRALSEAIHMETVTYKIHPFLERNFLDWNQMDLKHRNNNEELPVFWHILKSGGTTIKLMYAQCYNLVEACETGLVVDQKRQHTPEMTPQEWISQQQQTNAQHLSGGGSQTYLGASSAELTLGPGDWMQQQAQTPVQDHGSTMISPAEWFQQQAIQASEQQLQQGYGQRRLQTDELSVVESEDGRRYVNVDVTTPEGIAHAAQLGFAASPALTDVMFTPLLVDGAGALLNRNGRLFSVFRHPVLRVVSNFYYLQNAIWEPTYDEVFATWTIDDYAKSEVVESNWMVRSLLNKMVGRMEPSDILVAKETLKQKCLVGLIDDMEGTIRRFHDYFGFGSDDSLDCALQNFSRKQSGSSNSHNHPQLDPTSETWALLSKKNQLDLELFTYAKQLFVEQGQWLKEGRRWIETKKFHHNDPPRNP